MVRKNVKRRGLWLIAGLVMTTMIIVGTVAVGIASTPASSDIILVLDEDAAEFQYGDIVQTISVGEAGCDVTADSSDGPIMLLDGAIYTKDGSWVSDEAVGLHKHSTHRAIGVNSEGDGSCGLIESFTSDSIEESPSDTTETDTTDTSEALTLRLGSAPGEQMIESVDFDFESKLNTRVRVDFLVGDSVVFTEYYDLPDDAIETTGGSRLSSRVEAPQDPGNVGTLFDGIRISADTRKLALSGGASWDDPGAYRTVFHLTEGIPEVSIDATTNGTDGDGILVGEPITWDYLVTNTGDVALIDIDVTDVPLGTIACDSTALAVGASTNCSLSGFAEAGQFDNTGTVTATSPLGVPVEASDSSSYVGLLGCGDSDSNGGPGFEDDPLGFFLNGPTKDEAECGAAVNITTSNTTDSGGEQSVNIAPPAGFMWNGVTGLVTIEWDIEVPTNDGVARTVQQLIAGDPLSEIVVPWCEQAVGIAMSGSGSFYELDPVTTYPTATGSGDTCLVKQTTSTVEVGGDVFTQTTEVFYIWADPRLVRK